MTKKKVSNVCILMGSILIIIAMGILFRNIQLERIASASSAEALAFINEAIENTDGIENADEMAGSDDEYSLDEDSETIVFDGNQYNVVLSIPALNLELPIQSSWSYEQLNISPCIYQYQPLSIAGHNYTAHFGNIGSLEIGDTITLTYISGYVATYQVVSVVTIHETDIEEVVDSDYDLTLFTCNYNDNTERILVRFEQISSGITRVIS